MVARVGENTNPIPISTNAANHFSVISKCQLFLVKPVFNCLCDFITCFPVIPSCFGLAIVALLAEETGVAPDVLDADVIAVTALAALVVGDKHDVSKIMLVSVEYGVVEGDPAVVSGAVVIAVEMGDILG